MFGCSNTQVPWAVVEHRKYGAYVASILNVVLVRSDYLKWAIRKIHEDVY